MSLAISNGADSISVYRDGVFFSVDKTHPNYPALLEKIRQQPHDEDAIMELASMPRFVAKISAGRVEVSDNAVMFRDEPVGGYMVERLLTMLGEGYDILPWVKFMDNLMDNPNPEVRDDLYKWMEAGGMPVTPDGCLIGFKKVRANFTDVHTGKFDNSPGAELEMDRALCDPSRNNTCSTGFHFCSRGYLSCFSGDRVVLVKINPRDVTAIPKDYNNHKARCCRYTVQAELTGVSAAHHEVFGKPVLDLVNSQELPEILVGGKKPSEVKADPKRAKGPAPSDDVGKRKDVVHPKKHPAKRKVGKKPALAAPYGNAANDVEPAKPKRVRPSRAKPKTEATSPATEKPKASPKKAAVKKSPVAKVAEAVVEKAKEVVANAKETPKPKRVRPSRAKPKAVDSPPPATEASPKPAPKKPRPSRAKKK